MSTLLRLQQEVLLLKQLVKLLTVLHKFFDLRPLYPQLFEVAAFHLSLEGFLLEAELWELVISERCLCGLLELAHKFFYWRRRNWVVLLDVE